MKILGRLFSRNTEEKTDEDLIEISRSLRPIVDNITREIFAAHKDELVGREVTYVVPAVWGANKQSELTPTQREIHARVAPAIGEIVEKLGIEGLNPGQEFALGFLIKDLLITKIVYMVESYRNRLLTNSKKRERASQDLSRVDPVGNA